MQSMGVLVGLPPLTNAWAVLLVGGYAHEGPIDQDR